MTITIDFIADLPREVNLSILGNLNEQDLGICCQVSKTWNGHARDASLWRNIFPGVQIPSSHKDDPKKYIDERAVTSIGGVLHKFREHFSKLPPDKVVKFTCLFPFNPKRQMKFTFGYGNIKPTGSNSTPDIEEYCIFAKRIHVKDEDRELFNCDSFTWPIYVPVAMGYKINLPGDEEITSHNLTSIIDALYQNKIAELLEAGKLRLPRSSRIPSLRMLTVAMLVIGIVAAAFYLMGANSVR